MQIILKGQPKSTNNIYKSTCRGKFASVYMSADGKSLKEDYQWQVKSQWKSKPLKGDIGLDIDLYFKDKGKHDIDNYNKLVLDAMSDIVMLDDNQIIELTLRKYYDKNDPRVEIEIYEY